MLEMRLTVNRPRPLNLALFGFLAFAVLGCGSTAPSHVPNPVLFPVYAAGNAIHNARYNKRRAVVKAHVKKTFDLLIAEIQAGGGPNLELGYDLAAVPVPKRPALTAMLSQDPNLRRDIEAVTVSLMVHSD